MPKQKCLINRKCESFMFYFMGREKFIFILIKETVECSIGNAFDQLQRGLLQSLLCKVEQIKFIFLLRKETEPWHRKYH